MSTLIPYFGNVAPVADAFDCGGSHYAVEWMVATVDLEIAAGNAQTSTDDTFRDVQAGKVRLAGSLHRVNGKYVTEGQDGRLILAARWPDALYRALDLSYWRAYVQFQIELVKLDDPEGKSEPGHDENGAGDVTPGSTGSGN